jgi:uncharacterized membrane protein YtjA (UPF0391 family)
MMDILGWAIVAFIISIIAAALGFTGVARGVASLAKILFGVFLFLALLMVVFAILR